MNTEKEYEYHVVFAKPTQAEIEGKQIEGWEACDEPEGVIRYDQAKEPNYAHSKFYFRKEKKNS